jgi:site-specific DNA-methyltransferase (adenine-specific)
MYSFAGDTVLDPFGGSGSTTVAAIRAGRNSVLVEIDGHYVNMAAHKIRDELKRPRTTGPAVQSALFT